MTLGLALIAVLLVAALAGGIAYRRAAALRFTRDKGARLNSLPVYHAFQAALWATLPAALCADQSGSSGEFGAVPLFWGTAFIAMIVDWMIFEASNQLHRVIVRWISAAVCTGITDTVENATMPRTRVDSAHGNGCFRAGTPEF